MAFNLPKRVLVDQRNKEIIAEICKDVMSTPIAGFDIESQDRDRHQGFNILMKIAQEDTSDTDGEIILKKKPKKKTRLYFDVKRTKITGFSLYLGKDVIYYFNTRQADYQNRLSFEEVMPIFASKGSNLWIAHNAPFELTMLNACWGLKYNSGWLCSMQLCVSCYNDDTYSKQAFRALKPTPWMDREFLGQAMRAFKGITSPKDKLNPAQEKLLNRICDKSAHSQVSYESWVKEISFGYGLKKAVKQHFGHQMMDFDTLIHGYRDIGDLTGEQVLDYGCEDAYWCYKLFFHVSGILKTNNPKAWESYKTQENPMIYEYADTWGHGMRLKASAVKEKQLEERKRVAQILRDMKLILREQFQVYDITKDSEQLVKFDSWYTKMTGGLSGKVRMYKRVHEWAFSADADDYGMTQQVKCATGKGWLKELKGGDAEQGKFLSITHYMCMRYILLDLFGFTAVIEKGKIKSNADGRKEMGKHPILDIYQKLADAEQTMKLYLNPYLLLVDPETNMVHPIVSSKLNTRRTACQNPNGQQLSKYGESAYVRGFFVGDQEDHLIVSADWSAIELVLIGEQSGDPKFKAAYGQRPHADLHSFAAAGVMGISLEEFKKLPNKSEMRRDLGKGSNFEYWYSGWLNNTSIKMNWDMTKTSDAVKGYRDEFIVGESWRLSQIALMGKQGFLELPDGHRRYRFEATREWADLMRNKFAIFGSIEMSVICEHVIRRIQRRAGNQGINALIQGSCATLAKQTILAVRELLRTKYPHLRVRFMLPIHDELLYSVHKDDVLEFLDILYAEMIKGRGVVNNLYLDSSLAIGKTFQPWDLNKAPTGQIELMELNSGLPCISADRYKQKADKSEIKAIIDYLTAA